MKENEKDLDMPAEIDFEDSVPNPYIGKLRRRVTMNIDGDTVEYFKAESARCGVPYQTIMNMYLGQCAKEGKHLVFA